VRGETQIPEHFSILNPARERLRLAPDKAAQ